MPHAIRTEANVLLSEWDVTAPIGAMPSSSSLVFAVVRAGDAPVKVLELHCTNHENVAEGGRHQTPEYIRFLGIPGGIASARVALGATRDQP